MSALWRDEIVRRLAIAEAISLGSLGFFLGLYMVYALRDLALSEATVGIVIGFGGVGARTAYEVLSVSLRQRRLPAETLGRANGAFHAIMTTSLLAGALASAAMAGALSTRTVLWLGLGAGLFAPLPLLTLPKDSER